MRKRPISRVMLTGVVGLVLVFCLGGCDAYGANEIKARKRALDTDGCEHAGGAVVKCGSTYTSEWSDAAAAEVKAAVEGAVAQIQEEGEQAAETAVEAYTEEPRWEGATDYSQACSSSSGDLGC